MNLRTPGPTPIPPRVRQALSHDMVNHRGPEFSQVMLKVTKDLQDFFRTTNDLLIFTGSGTGGLEAAVANLFSPGERILSVSIGVFGERFATIASRFGADVEKLTFPYGRAADPDVVARKLAADRSTTSVLVTHNETSTGVTNPLRELARVVKEAGRLLVVDAISSIGSIELDTDAWGCDVVISGSQKSWMIPPGLAMISVSPRAWEAHERSTMPRFYWDFSQARRYLTKGHTPWTPAVSLFFALEEALAMMKEEGLDSILARHKTVGEFTRQGVKSLGLHLFADEGFASNTVTTVRVPEGMTAKEITVRMREEYGIVLAGGQGQMEGVVFRIGHLGYVDVPDIEPVLTALREIIATPVGAGGRA